MSTTPSPFEALLGLQEEDIRADQLRHRIDHHPALSEISALHDRSVALERATQAQRVDREGYLARQSEIEREVQDLDRRINEIDDRLRNDANSSFRDQTAMSNEMHSLVERKRALEDQELELMELLEPIELELAEVSIAQHELRTEAVALHERMVAEQKDLGAQVAEVTERRTVIADSIPDALLGEYERLRTRLGGIGASRLVHGICSGCNLALSATELDRLKHTSPDKLVHCDQCGRILIP